MKYKYKFVSLEDKIKGDHAFITPWSFIHLLSGMSLFFFGNILKRYFDLTFSTFYFVLIIHTIYEIKDMSGYFINIEEETLFLSNNSFFNSVGDTVACILGYYICLWYFNDNNYQIILYFTIFKMICFIIFIKYFL